MKKGVWMLALFVTAVTALTATPAAEFEVVSVKPVTWLPSGVVRPNGCRGTDTRVDPRVTIPLGRCVFQGANLFNLIQSAYAGEMNFLSPAVNDVISGGPEWVRSDRFDVEGVASDPSTVTGKDLNAMLKALLADRFKLRIRRESKEVQGYALV